MFKEGMFFQAYARTEEDENVQLEALFDALYMAGKVNEDDLFVDLNNRCAKRQGYVFPRREAAWNYLRYRDMYDGDKFWDKMNCYNHSPIELANQIYERTLQAVADGNEGTATYFRTGAPAVNGTIVCMGQMQDGQYITNPQKGAPRCLVEHFTAADILSFLAQYGAWQKDPLLLFGLWRTYDKDGYGKWVMCMGHHIGAGRREDYYEYALAAEYNCIDYTGTEF